MLKLSEKEILSSLSEAILEYDKEKAVNFAKKVIEVGIDPAKALEVGLGNGMREVGNKFNRDEIFLPHVVMAAEAMQAASALLLAVMSKEDAGKVGLGTVVIGTVKGDIHDIGKTLVSTMLSAAGFKVIDLGVDVSTFDFLRGAKEAGAKIIAVSALMTTTILEQRDLIEELKRKGDREKFSILVGGGAVSKAWADEIGADGFGKNMKEAVEVAKKLLGVH